MKCLKTDLQIRDGIEDNSKIIFVEPACGERDTVVTVSFWCICMCYVYIAHACLHPSLFILAITSTFMHEYQNDLAQSFSLRRRSAI